MRYFFLLCFVCWIPYVCAQTEDTTFLQTITIEGPKLAPYLAGSRVEKTRTGDEVETLSELLLDNPSIYIKSYGNGQLATIALRGTTASQTSILWNGININSPTLGQTDLSLIPTFLFDEVSLQYGTSSALYGSDAIGGTIVLGHSAPDFNKKFSAGLNQQIGSFGRFSTGVRTGYGNKRWQFKSDIFMTTLENDFPFTSPAVGHEKIQRNAAVKNYGADQQIFYLIREGHYLSGEAMYTFNHREIQPSVTNDHGDETLEDRNFRSSLGYSGTWGTTILTANTALITSEQNFVNDITTTIKTRQYSALVNVDKTIRDKTSIRYGLNYNFYNAASPNYHDANDHRVDFFASVRHAVIEPWIVSLSARQSIYDGASAPFCPTIGNELRLLQRDGQTLTGRLQVARGFRVPTLNDRYWIPGGNPSLEPEESLQFETGADWSFKTTASVLSVSATYHQSAVDNMIVWMPQDDGIWSPSNVQKTAIHGVETKVALSKSVGNFRAAIDAGYAYTRSINEKALNDIDQSTVGKQLPYVPVHNGSLSVGLNLRSWHVSGEGLFTGLRYTTLDNSDFQALDPYALVNASIAKKFNTSVALFQIKLSADNLFNIYYESLRHHAMPGRNFLISLTAKM